MPLGRKSRHSLLKHEAMLKRILHDILAGKKISHLSDDEVRMMVSGVKDRLAAVRATLAEGAKDCRTAGI